MSSRSRRRWILCAVVLVAGFVAVRVEAQGCDPLSSWIVSLSCTGGSDNGRTICVNGTTVCAGLGLRYHMKTLDRLGINAKWTRYFDVGDSGVSGSSFDRDFFALGATWSFGGNEAAE